MKTEVIEGILKKLNEDNYEEDTIYAKTEEELIENWVKYFDEYDEEVTKEDIGSVIEWQGEGWYVYAGKNFSNDCIMLEDAAIENELEWKTTKKNEFLILDDCAEDISEEFLNYLDKKIENNDKFKHLKKFNIIFNMQKFKNYSNLEEVFTRLKENFTKLFGDKKNIYHQYNIWDKWEECNFYESQTFIYAFDQKDIENIITDKFENFLEENDINIDIEMDN
ncbi:hypothetical protein [Clostridium sp. 001]|uniref:hypothetical protein n=1 Tax=Clostridium sp. 001 TaxID=1970093 RepID=UPI001C2BB9DD|nr:hypothetical protein [Clostridium sp. 001]QXE20027.1 hypothetical protein B5S50_15005 [Clostridium sp. 001]